MATFMNHLRPGRKNSIDNSITSVSGPYIQAPTADNFPLYRVLDNPVRNGEIYARSLFSLGHGVALHQVIGNLARPQEHLKSGVLLGDVGSISDHGSFTFAFNIFLPETHPVNQRRLPDNFVPFEPTFSAEDVAISEGFSPGAVMASPGIKVSLTQGSTSKVQFETSAREGAVVILPTGSIREDLKDPTRLHPYIKEHAVSWYQFYNGDEEHTAVTSARSNGTLWVVTGIDRVLSWASATFPTNRQETGGHRHFSFDGNNMEDPWEDNSGIRIPCLLNRVLTDGSQGVVFIRVTAIAISPLEWSRNVAYVPREIVGTYATMKGPIIAAPQSLLSSKLARIRKYLTPVEEYIPEFIFHPSIPLLHILITTVPSAQVAIVPDSVWISQLTKDHLNHSELLQLIGRVIDNFDIVNTDGIATFSPRSNEQNADLSQSSAQQNYSRIGLSIRSLIPWIKKARRDASIRGKAIRNMTEILSVSS